MSLEPRVGSGISPHFFFPLSQQHTLQSSAATSGLSCPLASNTCPFQARKRTAFSEGCSEEPSLHTEVFRQWMVMCCTTSELSSRRKFICTLPMSKSSCRGDREVMGAACRGAEGSRVRARWEGKGGPCPLLHSAPELGLG